MTALDEFVTRLFNPAAWVADAACRGMDLALFYPDSGSKAADAEAICATCPVFDPCRQYAHDNGERHGIWAGQSLNRPKKGGRPRRPPPVRADPTNGGRANPDRWKPIEHGTRRGYRAELRRGLEPCAACLDAEAERVRQVRNNSKGTAA